MNVYKVKYLPLNLYFTPSRHIKVGGNYKQCNLSEKGKTYTRYPGHFANSLIISYRGDKIKTKPSDWFIEEYMVVTEKIYTK